MIWTIAGLVAIAVAGLGFIIHELLREERARRGGRRYYEKRIER